MPHISHPTGQKIHAVLPLQRPQDADAGNGVHAEQPSAKRPDVGRRGGGGVHRVTQHKRPELATERGDDTAFRRRKLPELYGGRGGHRAHREALADWFEVLSARLRRVRVTCGDWKRIMGESVTTRIGITAVFLDPPYAHDVRDASLYAQDTDIAADVRAWAIANGDNPLLRIAYCGYDNEQFPDGWDCFAWSAGGGYGNRGTKGNANRHRERIWFSPFCLKVEDKPHTLSFLNDLED